MSELPTDCVLADLSLHTLSASVSRLQRETEMAPPSTLNEGGSSIMKVKRRRRDSAAPVQFHTKIISYRVACEKISGLARVSSQASCIAETFLGHAALSGLPEELPGELLQDPLRSPRRQGVPPREVLVTWGHSAMCKAQAGGTRLPFFQLEARLCSAGSGRLADLCTGNAQTLGSVSVSRAA